MLESINLYTCVFALLNFLILFFILKRVLFKPVMKYIDDRNNEIETSIKESEEANAEAKELKAQYELQLKNAQAEGQKIIDDMTARANKIYDSTVAEARQESQDIIARAKEDSEREHQLILQQSKAEITGLALAAASKVIGANMDNETNRKIIDKFLDETGAA